VVTFRVGSAEPGEIDVFKIDICQRLITFRDNDPASNTEGSYYVEILDSSLTRRIHQTDCFSNLKDAVDAGQQWDRTHRDMDTVWSDSQGIVPSA